MDQNAFTTSRGHAVFDSVRGGLERLDRSSTQEGRTNEGNISFQPDGFNVTSSHPTINDSSDTAVAWNWLADHTAVNNGDGSIPSEVNVNPEAGFSIVTYVGPGSTETVGHGLGVAPKMIIIKGRNNSDHWFMYNANLNNPTTEYMYWNTGSAAVSGANPWNGTAPTTSVFTIVNDGGVGSVASGNTYVAYCFAEVEGYSKFGKYKGNSGQPNGTFVHTGFKPAFVELKRFDAGDFWLIMDNKRSPHNARDNFLKGRVTLLRRGTTTLHRASIFTQTDSSSKITIVLPTEIMMTTSIWHSLRCLSSTPTPANLQSWPFFLMVSLLA